MDATKHDRTTQANIARNVNSLRGDRSLTWLADRVGTYPINISRVERGVNMPTAGLVVRLAEALGTSVDALVKKPKKQSRGG